MLVTGEPLSKNEDGDRSPTKTERDLDIEAIAKIKKGTTQENKMVRKSDVSEEYVRILELPASAIASGT